MDYKKFFDVVKKDITSGRLTQDQVDGCNTILAEGMRRNIILRHMAYILATTYHETAATMQPIPEYGKGKGKKYGLPAGPYAHVYYGRGYVQLTWITNYERASRALGVDFVKDPARALEPTLAAAIMFLGMSEGWFTTKKLSDYITAEKVDYLGARRIVNGTDKAKLIAGYASAFEKALILGGYDVEADDSIIVVSPPKPEIPVAPDVSVERRSFWDFIKFIFNEIFGRK